MKMLNLTPQPPLPLFVASGKPGQQRRRGGGNSPFLLLLCTLLIPSAIFLPSCNLFLSADVSGMKVVINSPVDSLYTANDTVTFWWEPLEEAEAYRWQLISGDPDAPDFVRDTLLTENLMQRRLSEGVYTWKIRIENAGSESAWQLRRMWVDRTVPVTPQVVSPVGADTLFAPGDSVWLSWTSQDRLLGGVRHPVTDSLILTRLVDSVRTPVTSLLIPASSARTMDVTSWITTGNTYHWRIASVDKAGNRTSSGWYRFVVE